MNDELSARQLWTRILSALQGTPKEFATIKQSGERGIWFRTSVRNGEIFVSKAIHNRPSSSVAAERRITEAEFIRTYPYYFRWLRKESGVRQEAVYYASQNTSYIFALIAHYG